MEYIAQEVREYLAQLGFRSVAEAVGHVEALDVRRAVDHWKASGLDIAPILMAPSNPYDQTMHHSVAQDHGLEDALDTQIIAECTDAIERREAIERSYRIGNVNRTVGTMLGSRVTSRWGGAGLPDDTVRLTFTGSAGQSFGAFVPKGVTMRLVGDTNDYLGKGLSGGRLVVRPDERATFAPEDNVIAGNVVGYGATSGEIFVNGIVGERFCVRNSGATAVVEGVGDHGCEYMTGGVAVVLGSTGRNFAAGMSGGVAFVYDVDGSFASRVNGEMVDVVSPSALDSALLRSIVERHATETDSPLARRLLGDWDATMERVRKVMPRDYARVLAVLDAAKADGLSEDETAHKVMESVRG